MLPAIWQYWEGPLPGYVELCLETVLRHHPEAQVLDPSGFDELWELDRDLPIDELDVPTRADFVRLYLLRHHGGLWLDADFVLLRPLGLLVVLPEGATFAGYRVDGESFANNLMYSRLGDPVIRRAYDVACSRLRGGEPVAWGAIGWEALAAGVEAHPELVHEIDSDLVSPVPWRDVHELEAEGDAAALAIPGRWGVMLANQSAGEALRAQAREEMLAGPTVLADLLRRALAGDPAPEAAVMGDPA